MSDARTQKTTTETNPNPNPLHPNQTASILPGNLVPSGLEFFAPGGAFTGGDFAPLALARFPNRDAPPKQWSGGTVEGYVITPDATTAARLPLWARQLREDPGSVYAHYLGGLEWDDAHQ